MLNPYSWLAIYLGIGFCYVLWDWDEAGKPAIDRLVNDYPMLPRVVILWVTAIVAAFGVAAWPVFIAWEIAGIIQERREDKQH